MWREWLLEQVATGPDAEEGPVRVARFFAAGEADGIAVPALVPDEESARLLALIAGQSPGLMRLLLRHPRDLAELAADGFLHREKPLALMHDELARRLAAGEGLEVALRRYCRREMLRLGARELSGDTEGTARELAHLASACLDVALGALRDELERQLGPALREDGRACRFVVFGMGKLGGEELNFSSDIDLIFVYETDAGSAGGRTLHEWFSRLAERLVRALADHTTEGGCFRVDLRLRPEGTRGPLVNSLEAMERYYESWGRPWERQAWVKARPVAGERGLGEELLHLLEPFIWRRSLVAGEPDEIIREMRRLLAQARREQGDEDDVKVGPGGIREVEFFIQVLQLIHGGRQPALREASTLRALDKLLFAGLVSERERQVLAESYLALRRLEHRLQIEELRQTHALPRTSPARALLARRLGYASVQAFAQALALRRRAVNDIFETLGANSGLESEAGRIDAVILLDPESTREARVDALARLGFEDAATSAEEIELLVSRPRSPFSPAAPAAMIEAAPSFIIDIAASPDPDLALRRIVDLAGRRGAGAAVWRLVVAQRPLARLLINLFGTSDYLSRFLVAHPELIEPLIQTPSARLRHSLEDHRTALAGRLALPEIKDEDVEESRLEALRRYQHEEILRIAWLDVAGELDAEAVSAELTALAEACLGETLAIVAPAVQRRWGGEGTPLAVIGLGKLGAGEMTYASDLDLIFVYRDPREGGAESRFEAISRLAQRVIHGLGAYLTEGRLYEVDTRLRPSGQKGALVSSLDGFRRYHEHAAALWERQALIKARAVAGDPDLGKDVEMIAGRHVWQGAPLDREATAAEIGRMRQAIEKEIARESPRGGRYHVKAGRGGLVDIEFLVQYLQLIEGPRRHELRSRATQPALDGLVRAGILDAESHQRLSHAYQFLRRLESRMRIVHDRSIAELESRSRPREMDKLARRMGYHGDSPGRRLLEEYLGETAVVRRIYKRYLPAADA